MQFFKISNFHCADICNVTVRILRVYTMILPINVRVVIKICVAFI